MYVLPVARDRSRVIRRLDVYPISAQQRIGSRLGRFFISAIVVSVIMIVVYLFLGSTSWIKAIAEFSVKIHETFSHFTLLLKFLLY